MLQEKNHTYINSKPFEGALIIKGEEFIDSLRSYNNKCGKIYILTLWKLLDHLVEHLLSQNVNMWLLKHKNALV